MTSAGPPHPAALPTNQLLQSCQKASQRRSGPGGQHRNKVETAIILTHLPSGVAAEANEKRSQAANLATALYRLRVRLALSLRTDAAAALAAYPSECWRGRQQAGKIAMNPAHHDFPTLLAEALDVLAMHGWDDRKAAQQLAVSRTQLVRLLKLEPAALALLNAQRERQGIGRLK